jgi:filamentous hemagglutinin family protein
MAIRKILLILMVISLNAKPTGFHLRAGSATVDDGTSFVIQSDQNAMIDWESFSIESTELVRFDQRDARCYVLNRVTGANESSLNGKLFSNGMVYLINPNGITIGHEAEIQTAGFIASTLDLDPSSDILTFVGTSSKAVINRGNIHSETGDVYLVAHEVENSGEIRAKREALLAGHEILIRPHGAPEIRIRSDETLDRDLLRENPYAFAIRHSGKSRAETSYLIGGDVQLQGLIDVSGESAGGEVHLKGEHVWMAADAEIRADAKKMGNGGKVILWGERSTIAHGNISADGGPEGGDGGFIEISSPQHLIPNALVSTVAPRGKNGVFYLDPCVVTISTAVDSGNSYSAPNYSFSTNPSANINIANLETNLISSDVVIDATASGSGTVTAPSITVEQAITWSSGNSLLLNGGDAITVNSGAIITNTSSGSLSMIVESGGEMTVNAAIDLTSGILNITGGTITINSPITTGNTVSISNSGTLTVANSAFINTGAFAQSGGGAVEIGGEVVTSGGSITFTNEVILTGNLLVNTGGTSGNIAFSSYIDGDFALNLIGDNIDFNYPVGMTVPLSSLSVFSSGTVTVGANQTVIQGPMTYTGPILLTSAVQFTDSGTLPMQFFLPFGSTVSFSGPYPLTLMANNTYITVMGATELSSGGSLQATGSVSLTFEGPINTSYVGSSAGSVALTASAGSVSVESIDASGTTPGNITIRPTNLLSDGYPVGLAVLGGDLNGGAITISASRTSSPLVATIVSSASGNDVSITGTSFIMGNNEAMTVLGDLTFDCPTVTLGDVIALDSLTIASSPSDTVNLLTHGPYSILSYLGTTYISPSLHFFGGSGYTNLGTSVPSTGILKAANLGYSDPITQFLPLLTYNGHILNYDTTLPTSPSPPSGFVAFAMYRLAIADAQLSDLLPIFPLNYYNYCLLPKHLKKNLLKCHKLLPIEIDVITGALTRPQ